MMKKSSQISVALVCSILGFMLAYQFKSIIKQQKSLNISQKNTSDITVEVEQYKKDKKELEKKVDELEKKAKGYEDQAAKKSDSTKHMLEELDRQRLINGNLDVKGPGVTIYLNPNNNIFGRSPEEQLTDKHLIYLVNELRFADAEAISINGIRVVNTTGIRTAGNYIMVDDTRVSPTSRITITAIGNPETLYAALEFPESFQDFRNICEVKYEKSKDIEIKKNNKVINYKYAKPVAKEQ
ncbi:DUF881 domain-containing protein [Clostridium oceanicum]|uniref:DUF881 domain-containing protein n=2 Tax=Clostridium oceanicum TaxID=1543 RepID=A0ABN1JQ11_9CLOT